MNIFCWLLCLTVFLGIFAATVELHHSTVCRQKAWTSSSILLTRSLLKMASTQEVLPELSCGITVMRNHKDITWRQGAKVLKFDVKVVGQL